MFSLTWPASLQIYWKKRKRLHKRRVHLPQDLFGRPTWAAVSLFWDSNMTAVTSCENTPYCIKHFPCGVVLYIVRHSLFWQPFYFKSFQN